MGDCPDEARWALFLADEVEVRERAELEAHLDRCGPCRERLTSLAGSLPGRRPSDSGGGGVLGVESRAWLDRLAALGPEEPEWPGADWPPELPGLADFAEVARGGMGVIYRARQVALDRAVAVKLISAGGRLTPNARARAAREARILARVDHPNIVRIHDVGEVEGLPYLVMEWVEGGDLGDRLEAGPMAPREAAALARTLALAVEAAHAKGIIHRDLKPRNVLIGPDGTPRLTDFGLARSVDPSDGLTAGEAVMGTPGYMAPEQVESSLGAVGPPADVYALGATLYAMLTGRPPFAGSGDVQVLRQVVEREPAAPRTLDDAIPRDLETICLKCLEKRPERRYASAGALADELGRFLDGRPIAARRVGPVGSALRWARRNPRTAALGSAVAGLLLLLAVGGMLVAREQARLRRAAEAERRRADGRAAEARANADWARREQVAAATALHQVAREIEALAIARPDDPAISRFWTTCMKRLFPFCEEYFLHRPPSMRWTALEVRMLWDLGMFRVLQNRRDEAQAIRRRCLELGMPLLEAGPRDAELACILSQAESMLATELWREPRACLPGFERAERIARDIGLDDLDRPMMFYTRAMAAGNLAYTYHRLDRHEAAATVQSEALDFARRALAGRPDDRMVAAQVVEHLYRLATERIDLGRLDEVPALLDEATERLDALRAGGATAPGRNLDAMRKEIDRRRGQLAEAIRRRGVENPSTPRQPRRLEGRAVPGRGRSRPVWGARPGRVEIFSDPVRSHVDSRWEEEVAEAIAAGS